jgi:thiol-disulfide isomerase/thioredoxin
MTRPALFLVAIVLSPFVFAGEAKTPRDGQELVGTKMPAMTFDRWIGTAGGKPLDVTGRPVLYRWWTSGCSFCTKTLPAIETLRTRYEPQGLQVVAVFHPKPPREVLPEAIRNSAKKIGFDGVIAADDSWSQLKRVWLSEERPATSVSFLVDAKGVIRFVHPGTTFYPSDDPQKARENEAYRALEAAIQKVLAETKESGK